MRACITYLEMVCYISNEILNETMLMVKSTSLVANDMCEPSHVYAIGISQKFIWFHYFFNNICLIVFLPFVFVLVLSVCFETLRKCLSMLFSSSLSVIVCYTANAA